MQFMHDNTLIIFTTIDLLDQFLLILIQLCILVVTDEDRLKAKEYYENELKSSVMASGSGTKTSTKNQKPIKKENGWNSSQSKIY